MAADMFVAEINLVITEKIILIGCPYAPVTAVTGHRNRTVTPILLNLIYKIILLHALLE